MAFVDYISLENNDIIGIWKNQESLEDLLFELKPEGELLKQFNQISLEKRKKEFCITHLLIQELTGEQKVTNKDEYGKPGFINSKSKISISHADVYSAVFISEHLECGVDVEVTSARILKLGKKFVSEYENLYVTKGKECLYYTIIWCVKEAIYKWYAKKGLDFKENMIIHPFTILQSGGPVYYEFVKDGRKYTNIAQYQLFDQHVIAWLQAEAF